MNNYPLSKTLYRNWTKRVLDLVLGSLALIVLLPILLLLYGIIRITIGSPVIFKQRRPGINGIAFTIYKFRTMTNRCDADGNLLPDEMRITSIGKNIRALSLDELPEIVNVLKGDMSLVGPRPLMMEYLNRYTLEQARRHEVKPGITGWAQVNGRNGITWDVKFAFDVWYVDHVSLLLDFKILVMTVIKVLAREGISEEGYISASDFIGSQSDPPKT